MKNLCDRSKLLKQLEDSSTCLNTEEDSYFSMQMSAKEPEKPKMKVEKGPGWPTRCTECGSSDIEHVRREAILVCNTCGLVLKENIIDETPEWRNFTQVNEKGEGGDGTNMERVGQPIDPYMQISSMSTVAGPKAARESQLYAIQLLETGKERSYKKDLHMLQDLVDWLSINGRVHSQAIKFLRMHHDKREPTGKRATRCATLLLLAATAAKAKINRKDLYKAAKVSATDVASFFKKISGDFPASQNFLLKASDHVSQVAEDLKMPSPLMKIAMAVAKKIECCQEIQGRRPTTIAGAALMMVLRETKLEQKKMGQASKQLGVSLDSIMAAYSVVQCQELMKEEEIELLKSY